MMLEFHMLKNYPPVNLNRDDSGAPKTCFFGGVQRGRISSQCLKRGWRTSQCFKALGSMGIRTRCMPQMVGERLREAGVEEECVKIAEKMLTGVANKDGTENKKGNFTAQIVLYAPEDIDCLTERVQAEIEKAGSAEKFKDIKAKEFAKLVEGAKVRPVTADIALFGRMVTSDCFRDVDAAMQVAHAISTHAVNRESDYFTAVDDLWEDRDVEGAGMMGDTDYNSCCYYEYASLDLDQLHENLKYSENSEELIRKLVPALFRAMAYNNPSGNQNSFAGQVLPVLILVECKRDKIPLSYVNAFEIPVSQSGKNPMVVETSIRNLFDEIDRMDEAYGLEVTHRAWMSPRATELAPKKGERVASFAALSEEVGRWMEEEA